MAKLAKKIKTTEGPTLDEVGAELAKVIPAKNSYDTLRKQFSELADEHIAETEQLPETTAITPLGVEEAQVLREAPDYEVLSSEESDDEIVWRLRKKPSTFTYRYYDADSGKVVERGVTAGRKALDLEELLEDHPEYEEYVNETYSVDGDTVALILKEVPELAERFRLVSRTMDMDQVDEAAETNKAIISHIQSCTYSSPSSNRTSLKKATPEEAGE